MRDATRPPLRERAAARLVALRKRVEAAHAGISTTMELAGCAFITVGAATIYAPAGWIVGGLLTIGLGYLIGRPA